MKRYPNCFSFVLVMIILNVSRPAYSQDHAGNNLEKAKQTLDKIYKYYSEENTFLLHENYPFDASYSASYLAEADTGQQKRFAYLWPFSGTFSGVNALFRTTKDKRFLAILEKQTLPALEAYYDPSRQPACYASYLREAGLSDRFYDDNVWLGIDFVDLYMQTKNKKYLDKSVEIWQFILSGTDDKLGGGIYWCEQKKRSKNTCSNAPGSVLALKLFEATRDSIYFSKGLELYNWTKSRLQDPGDHLYYDNISLREKVDERKYPYNSGQMLQAAALLYKLTGNRDYLKEAQQIAASCMEYFTADFTSGDGQSFRLIKGDLWFIAVMFRGFMELYHLDKDKKYLDLFNKNLNYAWDHTRNEYGLFPKDWSRQSEKKVQWLLAQAAMVEMYATIASVLNK